MSEKACIKCLGEKTGNNYSYCKPCKAEISKAWRAANLHYYRGYYTKNKEALDVYYKKYQKENQEKHSEASRKYLKNNPEYVKIWKLKNKEKLREYSRKREALKLGNGHSPYTEDQVLSTYGTSCNECKLPIDMNAPRQTGLDGWENGLQIDHFIPISKGGPDTLKNVRPTHGLCNLRKLNN